MVDVLGQHRPQLPASQDQHPVQHLTASLAAALLASSTSHRSTCRTADRAIEEPCADHRGPPAPLANWQLSTDDRLSGTHTASPVKVVSQRLGYANTAITSDLYQHVLRAMDAEAANTVARLILDGEQQESKSSAVNPRQRDGLSRCREKVKCGFAAQLWCRRGDLNLHVLADTTPSTSQRHFHRLFFGSIRWPDLHKCRLDAARCNVKQISRRITGIRFRIRMQWTTSNYVRVLRNARSSFRQSTSKIGETY